ncbi:hypothetical protein [Modestobacter sp. Leaf380]|uniref:hypothetical protein n=1 Tax=Modestobacter sp. Leaf380 TaxID=1736356 RepID=UPI0006FDA8E4|nr:hypothetical protein [Modestobacter sp. Leaf380]KQS71494.1 hypothetical protein ASG41_19645 [Modestobacter sp. Leaf380]
MGVPAAAQAVDVHLLAALDDALSGTGRTVDWVLTHVDRSGPDPRVTASWQVSPGPDDRTLPHRWALALGGAVLPTDAVPQEGRVVRFPGGDDVPVRVTVADLVAGTAIDRVVGIGSPALPGDVVDSVDGHLRPVRHPDGVELLVDPAGPGTWRPVEISTPHECCGGH